MKIKEILAKLEGVTPTMNGWQACCPAHGDEKPSLSIAVDDGKTLLHCHAGCRYEDIVKKIGLEMQDLFPPAPSASTVVNTYDYQEEGGNLLFQVQRHKPKTFTVRRPDGSGGWINNLDGIRRVPYRLPDIINRKVIVMGEGEKDADTCWNIFNIASSTTPLGAGKWRPEYARYFADKIMVLVPHKDGAGQKHMRTIACALFGVAKKIKIIDPPFGNDLTEYYQLGGTREQLIRLINATPAVTAEKVKAWEQTGPDYDGFSMKSFDELKNQPKKKGLCTRIRRDQHFRLLSEER